MTFDDVEGFLKFLDNVSFQLACLLDVDGDHRAAYSNSKRSYTRPRLTNASLKSSSANRNTKIKQNLEISASADRATANMRQPLKSRRPATRARTRRKQNKSNDLICSNDSTIDDHESHQNRRQRQLSHQTNHDQRNQDGSETQGLEGHQLNHHHQNSTHQHQHSTNGRSPQQQPGKPQHSQGINGNTDTHNLESQLALSIVDELVLGTPISPPTHLSPIEPSIQFSAIQQQHYYSAPRGHLDSYQMHDDFSATEVMPITGTQHAHINQQQHHHQHHQEQQQQQQANTHQSHLVGHQTSVIRVNPLNETALNATDCYTHPHPHANQNHHHQLHQNEHEHQHHQHHQHLHHQTLHPHNLQQQHQHQHQHQHHPQYHQLDQQWVINSTTNTTDSGLQLGNAETSSLDHVVSMSPVATHQPLDHVQFNAPLYHHSYYNQQQEQLDSFQHINEDYTNNSATLGSSGSSPLEHHHRMQQEQDQSQTQVRMHPLDINSSSDNSNGYEHQHTQHHNHQVHHHNEHHLHTYQHQHSQHSSMVPLLNGIEPNGVIIQDINLAAASWSSPEDLYSI